MSETETGSKKSSGASSESKASETKSSETKSADTGGAGGKSARESVGGTSQVHYGYFSSVRSNSYRSGWDGLWSKKSRKR